GRVRGRGLRAPYRAGRAAAGRRPLSRGLAGARAARSEAGAALGVRLVDHVAVAADVPALAADDEHHEVLAAAVRDPARRGRRDVEHPARAEQPLLVAHLYARRPGVDEVQLVLLVVVVVEPGVVRRHHDDVHPERLDAERLAHLAEAVALAQLLDRPERVAHLAP